MKNPVSTQVCAIEHDLDPEATPPGPRRARGRMIRPKGWVVLIAAWLGVGCSTADTLHFDAVVVDAAGDANVADASPDAGIGGCLHARECATDEVCSAGACTAPASCVSGVQCAGLVCDTAAGRCAECILDVDCIDAALFCDASTHRCEPDVCNPGEERCDASGTHEICDARGAAFEAAACAMDTACDDAHATCTPIVCTANEIRCTPASVTGTEVCSNSGLVETHVECGANQSCSAGGCLDRICAPGSVSGCVDGASRRVCAADGLGYGRVACGAMQGCVAGSCEPWACTPDTATSCIDATTASVCASDGFGYVSRGCGASETCSAGVCRSIFAASLLLDSRGAVSLDVADYDGDGDQDIAAGTDAKGYVVANVAGTPTISWNEPGTGLCGTVRFNDANADGRVDLAVSHCDSSATGSNGYAAIFLGSAAGLSTSTWFTTPTRWAMALGFPDYDDDGDGDFFVGTLPNLGTSSEIFRYDGSAFVTSPVAWTSPTSYRVVDADFADIDGDGDDDMVLAAAPPVGSATGAEGIHILRYDAGSFTNIYSHNPISGQEGRVDFVDVDGDGDRDLVSGRGTSVYVYSNSNGSFSAVPSPYPAGTTIGLQGTAIGDFDGDGDFDLGFASSATSGAFVMENSNGAFARRWFVTDTVAGQAAAFADWNSDGRLDLVVGGSSDPLRVYVQQ
jgi:hypothetical protein